jgi:thiol-disulfide isomerase/thioredoxin
MGELRIAMTMLLVWGMLLLTGCGEKHSSREQNGSLSRTESTPAPQAPPPPSVRRFAIRDIDRRESTIEFTDSHVRFHKIRQPLVLLTLFADWCPPCRGMLPYLNRLQKENSDALFVIGILVHSPLNAEELREFMLRYQTNFFISNHPDNDALGEYLAQRYGLEENYPLPLTLIFKNGRYVMHISGAIPYEMLQTLVDQLKEKKKKKE